MTFKLQISEFKWLSGFFDRSHGILYVFPCVLTVKLFPVTCEYIKGEKQFYYRAQKFYEDVPASEEGMMGDFVEISNVDLEGSRQFLQRFVVSHKIVPHIKLTE